MSQSKAAPWVDDTIAPNGRPVKENFARWFGASKVVDASGAPLVVYHGTAGGDITEFRYGCDGNTADSSYELEGLGFFFTPSEQAADGYANNAAEVHARNVDTHRRTIAAYMSVANPKFYDSLSRLLTAAGMAGGGEFLRQDLVAQGYDGIIFGEEAFWGPLDQPSLFGLPSNTDGGYHDVIVAFRPEQIKSAHSNNGNYDLSCANMADEPVAPVAEQDLGARSARRPRI